MFFYKKLSPKLILLNDFFFWKIPSIFDIENWLWKYDFGTFWWTVSHRRIFLNRFPLSMLTLGQKSCILGPTIFKIPQPNWRYCRLVFRNVYVFYNASFKCHFCSHMGVFFDSIWNFHIRCGRIITNFPPYPTFRKSLIMLIKNLKRFCDLRNTSNVLGLRSKKL